MNHMNGFNALSRDSAHRKSMTRNMVTQLLRYERIETTKAKALQIRRMAERLITRGKTDSLHNRREVAKYISDEAVLAKLFKDIGPRMKERAGGYTRVLKLGFRRGDMAQKVLLELVDYVLPEPEAKDADKKAKAKSEATKASAKGETNKAKAKA